MNAPIVIEGTERGRSWAVARRDGRGTGGGVLDVYEYELDPDDNSDPSDDRLAPDGMYRGDCTAILTVPATDVPALVDAVVAQAGDTTADDSCSRCGGGLHDHELAAVDEGHDGYLCCVDMLSDAIGELEGIEGVETDPDFAPIVGALRAVERAYRSHLHLGGRP